MATRLDEAAQELSTYAVDVSFLDEEEAAAVLRSITWRLTRRDGAVVNSRSAEAVSGTHSGITIALTGDDLRRWDNDSGLRYLTVRGVYDSALGDNLSHSSEAEFVVQGLTGINSEAG